MNEETLKQMCAHLEFLGYEIRREADVVIAKHDVNLNILLRPMAGGVLLTAAGKATDNAKRDRLGYLDLLNSLNAKARVARFYADEDSDLRVEAWYPDYYNRSDFGMFMEAWDRDCMLVIARPEEARRYIA